MTPGKQLAAVGLGLAAVYVIWRIQAANGGPVVWVSPLAMLSPGNPSPGGTQGAGDTNPVSFGFSNFFGTAFKLPGNQSAIPSATARPGSNADPLLPPSELTRTAQPQSPNVDTDYLPNLGDPNFSAWSYLASTPPDLFWGVNG